MPTALITGASSGIGLATAKEFARRGFSVIVLARRKPVLDALLLELKRLNPAGMHSAWECDIAKRESIEQVVAAIREIQPSLNVLVNNAGSFEWAPFDKSQSDKIDEMINVNLRGVIFMTKACLPMLKVAARSGEIAKIVNISSVSGLWGFSNMAVYTATKFAVTGLTSALRREFMKDGIDVASIHPGPVRNRDESFYKEPPRGLVMMPDAVAKQIYELAIGRGGKFISHPLFSLLEKLEGFSPVLVDKLLKKMI